MKKLDLRQVGTIFGHELYIDVADTPYFKGKKDVLSSRDMEELMVKKALESAFGMNKPKKGDGDEKNRDIQSS